MAVMAVQGHRGSPDPANGIGENTLEAFVRARRLGADGIELDVRLTADGAMAVHHNPVVPGLGAIRELAAGELPPQVPSLAQALQVCRGMTVNIEIKNLPSEPDFDPDERLAHEVVALVDSGGWASEVIVSSFWPDTLAAVRGAGPEIRTGLLLAGWFDPDGAVQAAVSRGCTALHPVIDLVTADLVADAHGAGLSVATWTVNERHQLKAMAAAGVDTVITDDVTFALAVLGRR
jgi:glycerophosphoryl diester phosphodiesterase